MKRYIRSNSNNSIELSEIQKLYKQIQKLFKSVLMTDYSNVDMNYEFTPFEHNKYDTYSGECTLHSLSFYSDTLKAFIVLHDNNSSSIYRDVSVTDQSGKMHNAHTIVNSTILDLWYRIDLNDFSMQFNEPFDESDVNNYIVFESLDEIKAITANELKNYLKECIRCYLIRAEDTAAEVLRDSGMTSNKSEQVVQNTEYSIQDMYDAAAEYVNDTDWMYEYDTPESFGNALIKRIESEYRKLTKKEKKYVMDQAKLIDFDDYDADNY